MVFIAFISGSLPFSVWIGKFLLHVDIRQFGDGNPGAANTFIAGNKQLGVVALILDISKAAAPVGLAYFNLGIRGAGMALIAMAPILGHVFSPFLRFQGGKALATALGVWIGLTIWKASLPAVVGALIGIALFTPPGWSVMCAMSGILLVLLIWLPDPLLLAVWFGEILILSWTHRLDLNQGIHLCPWLVKLLVGRKSIPGGKTCWCRSFPGFCSALSH
jgi:glycerol-3-phosphate acyltransferase PlsY